MTWEVGKIHQSRPLQPVHAISFPSAVSQSIAHVLKKKLKKKKADRLFSGEGERRRRKKRFKKKKKGGGGGGEKKEVKTHGKLNI